MNTPADKFKAPAAMLAVQCPVLKQAITAAAAADELLHRMTLIRPDLDKATVLNEASKHAAGKPDSTSAIDVLRQWWRLVTESRTLPFEPP